jgi:hypothetical protein
VIENLEVAIRENVPETTGVYLGREHLGEHDRPPRIVLVPRFEAFTDPAQPRGSSGVVRAKNRTSAVEAHLWGATFGDVDAPGGLLEQLVQALEVNPGRGQYSLGQGQWLDSLDEWITEGRVLIVPIQLTVAVRAKPETLATINNVTHRAALDFNPPVSIPT